jgi:hypothetical protein
MNFFYISANKLNKGGLPRNYGKMQSNFQQVYTLGQQGWLRERQYECNRGIL